LIVTSNSGAGLQPGHVAMHINASNNPGNPANCFIVVVKNTGDGMLVEFSSVVDAVRCAAETQRAMIDRNADIPEDKHIRFRIEVHLGDVIVEPEDIFGDDVNIASRLEALAEPGGICISRAVRDRIGEWLPYSFEDIGEGALDVERAAGEFYPILRA
jgi:class 3 adenylate cyclase